jgi:hypothetical protein
MKDVTGLLKDILQTLHTGARNRDKTVLGFMVVVVISLTLIILGLIKP